MQVVGPPRWWIGEFYGCFLGFFFVCLFVCLFFILFFSVIGGFCGCSVGMAEVGCGSRHCGL